MPRGIYDRTKMKKKPGRPKGSKNKSTKSVWQQVPEVTTTKAPEPIYAYEVVFRACTLEEMTNLLGAGIPARIQRFDITQYETVPMQFALKKKNFI